jgi:hypothetical protein
VRLFKPTVIMLEGLVFGRCKRRESSGMNSREHARVRDAWAVPVLVPVAQVT